MSRHISSLLRSILILALLAGQLALPTGSVLAAAGDLDASFSTDGYLLSTDGSDVTRPNAFFKDILVLPGGKILTGGNTMDNAYHQGDLVIEQYNADGTLDTSFSGDGWTSTSFGDGWFEMYAIERLTDGRIVAAGTYFYMIGADMYREFALARFCPDGSLDTGVNCPALQPKFGANGTVRTVIEPVMYKTNVLQSMVVQPDGKILTAGYVQESSSSIMAMARYNEDGSLDTSFGGSGSGMLIFDLAGTGTDSNQIYSLALRPDGRIIAGGYATDPGTWETMFALVQFCPDGSLDDGSTCGFSGFGAGGIVITYNPDLVNYYDLYIRKIVLQADGSIIAAGYRTNESYVNGYALAKYQPNGDLDPGFGTNGMVFATVDAGYPDDSIYALAVQSDGKIVVGGRNYTEGGGASRFAVARYSANGSLDASFGTNGVVLENLGNDTTDSTISALEIDGSGNLLAAGSAKDAVSSKALLLRFTTSSDSTPPSITGVSIPNVSMRVGDNVTAMITVDSDTDTFALVSGTIGGFPLGFLNKFNDTTYTAVFTVTNGGTDVLASANIPVSLVLRDSAGNQNDPYTTAISQGADPIDANKPAVGTPAMSAASDTGSSNSDGITKTTQPVFTGTAEASSTVTIYVDNVAVTTTPANGAGSWSYTPAAPLGEGAHAIKATATDAAGNTSAFSSAASFTIDVTPPAAPVVSAPADASITNLLSPAVSGTALANGTVTVLIDGSTAGSTTVDGSGNWSFTPLSPFADGSHTAKATVTDAAGNTSVESGANTFTVDATAPAAPVLISPTNDSRTNDDTPVITGTAEPDSTVKVYIDGSLAGTDTPDESGDWSVTTPHLAENSHTVNATATDAANNTSSLSSPIIFYVDTAAPAAPVVITPANGSSTNDSTPTISGSAEIGSTVTVSIDGTPVGTATTDGSGAWVFIPGSALPDGAHSVSAAATDAANNTGASSAANSFTVDTTPPAAPVVLTPADGSVTGDSTPAVTGTADPATTVTILVDGTPAGTEIADGAGNWSFTLGMALSEGSHTVKATASDALNNTSADSNTNTFTVDLTPPAAPVVTAPANGSSTNSTLPAITGTAEAGSTVTVLVDGTPMEPTDADGSGNWSFTLETPLADGSHTVKAAAADAVGNTGPQSSANTFTVDTSAPAAPAITAPANNSFTSDTTPSISGTAEANSTVTVLIDGTETGTAAANGAGVWSFTPVAPLEEGSHTVRANATDAAGNTGSDSAAVTFTVDTQRPLGPVVLSPADNTSTNNTTPMLTGAAEANGTIAIYDGEILVGQTTANGDGAWAGTTDVLAEGSHTLKVYTTDRAGNVSATAGTLTLIVDTTAPTAPTIASPADGSSTNDPTPVISGTAEAYSTVTVTIDAAEAGTASADDFGQWTFIPSTDLSEGDHTVRAKATDAAQNTGPASSAVTFTVDLTEPEVELPPTPEPLDDAGDEPYLVTLTFTDDQGIDPASLGDGDVALNGPDYVLEGKLVSSTPAGTGFTVTYRLDPPALGWGILPGGTFTVLLVPNQVRDLSGNYLSSQTVTSVERPYLLFVPIFYPAK